MRDTPTARVHSGQTVDRALEGALHDLANSLAAARSYAEVVRQRSRVGAMHHPEPVLDYLVEELDRLARLMRDARGARDSSAAAAAEWARDEIVEPAKGADASLALAEGFLARDDAPPPVRELLRAARHEIDRIRTVAARVPETAEARLAPVDVDDVLDEVLEAETVRALLSGGGRVRREPLPAARADPALLARALQTLILAALGAGRHRDITIGGRVGGNGEPEYWIRAAPRPEPGPSPSGPGDRERVGADGVRLTPAAVWRRETPPARPDDEAVRRARALLQAMGGQLVEEPEGVRFTLPPPEP